MGYKNTFRHNILKNVFDGGYNPLSGSSNNIILYALQYSINTICCFEHFKFCSLTVKHFLFGITLINDIYSNALPHIFRTPLLIKFTSIICVVTSPVFRHAARVL